MRGKVLCTLCLVLFGAGVLMGQTITEKVATLQQKSLAVSDDALAEIGRVAIGERDFRRPGEADCPAGYLCGQSETGNTWLYSDMGFANPSNPACIGRVTSEKFPPPGEPNLTLPIQIVRWYGTYLNDTDSGGCSKPHLFNIRFYNDDGTGKPNRNSVVAAFTVAPTKAQIVGQLNFGGPTLADKWEFTVVLPAPVNMPSGHFSIASAQLAYPCVHLLGPSLAPEGDSLTWRWYDNCAGFVPATGSPYDIRYCFMANRDGVCCNPWTGDCGPATELDCADVRDGRFLPLPATCNDFVPPCIAEPGACCDYDGGTCEDGLTYVECEPPAGCRGDFNCDGQINFDDIDPFVVALVQQSCCDPTGYNCDVNQDGSLDFGDIDPFVVLLSTGAQCPNKGTRAPRWLGPGSTCVECCFVDCPPGSTQEDEPCGADMNGGCNDDPVTPESWDDILCGPQDEAPIYCGYIYAENGTRDTDWYRFELLASADVNLVWEAEFPAWPGIVKGTVVGQPTCSDGVWGANIAPCSPTRILFGTFPAGEYWVVPLIDDGDAIFDGYPCGFENKYWFAVECTVFDCPDYIDCAGMPLEGEPQCADEYKDQYNGGCDVETTPPHFLPLNCGDIVCGTGGTFFVAGEYTVDSDWWEVVVTEPTQFNIQVETEFPMTVQVVQPGPGNTCPGVVAWTQNVGACAFVPAEVITRCLPAGRYWLRFAPRDGVTVDCALGLNYRFFVQCVQGCTPCSITCPTPNVPEGETCGGAENQGCWVTPADFETYTCDTVKCGTLYAADGVRDGDWYEFSLAAAKYLTFVVQTEIPVVTGFMNTAEANCGYLYGYWINVDACVDPPDAWYFVDAQQQPVTFGPGTFWWVLLPEDFTTQQPLFYNYPCGTENDVWFAIECSDTPPAKAAAKAVQAEKTAKIVE